MEERYHALIARSAARLRSASPMWLKSHLRPTRSKRHVPVCPLSPESDLRKSGCDPPLRRAGPRFSMRDAVLQGKGALLVGSKRFAAWASVAHLAHLAHPPTHHREVDGA